MPHFAMRIKEYYSRFKGREVKSGRAAEVFFLG
jgi:hypothetical protein